MEQRTILVTGSAGGIGAATAARLDRAGHRVIGLDIREADIVADLATARGRSEAVEAALGLADHGLNGIIACAGLAGASPDAVIGVNYFGAIALFDGLSASLAGADAPRAVAVSSSAIILGHDEALVAACLAGDEAGACRIARRIDSRLVYASSKVALSRWIRRTAILPEWAGSEILLNAIAPGTVLTDMTRPILATREGRSMLAEATPIAVGSYAEPDDVAPLLDFLASPDCRYIVGQTIFIDGGKDAIRRGDRLP